MSAVAAPPQSPYKGLAPYEEDDAWRFFGRRSDQQVIISNLHAYRLTVLYGASGVGKSSVLNAGVMPDLRKPGKSKFVVVNFRGWTGDDPITCLGEALRSELQRTPGSAAAANDLPVSVPNDPFQAWSKVADRDLLFVLDQFEEYFLYHPQELTDGSFAQALASAVCDVTLRANFLISIREDALARLDYFKGHIPNLFDNYLRLPYLDERGAREAITRPVDEFNKRSDEPPYAVDGELVDELLRQVRTGTITIGAGGRGRAAATRNGVGSKTIETPFLQVVLDRLWKETVARGSRELSVATLHSLGGAEKIIDTQLDSSMATLGRKDREMASRAFYYLVTPSGAKVAYKADDLAEYTRTPFDEMEPVLDRLAGEPRILRRDNPPGGETYYEIFHDVLAGAILDWRERYLGQKSAKQLRYLLQAGALLIVLVLFGASLTTIVVSHDLAAAAVDEKSRVAETAQASAALAETQAAFNASTARSRQLASAARSQLNIDPRLGATLAREALLTQPTVEADAALREALGQFYELRTLGDHDGRVTTAILSPDGTRVVTASEDGTARIWDLTASDEPIVLDGQAGAVRDVAYAPDGQRVVTVADDGVGRVWDAGSGALELELATGDMATVVAYSPSGQLIAIGGTSGTISLWSADGAEVQRVLVHGQVASIAFSPDGRQVLAASSDGFARVWDVASGQVVAELHHPAAVVMAAFSPDWSQIVTAGSDGAARVWDATTSQLLAVLMPPTLRTDAAAQRPGQLSVNSASFSPDGKRVVTASSDNLARVWNVENVDRGTATLIADLRGHTGDVFNAAFSGDNRFVVTASRDSTARIWDASSGETIAVLRGHRLGVSSAVIDVNSKIVVTGSFDGTARVWQAGTSASAVAFKVSAGPVHGVAIDRDGTRAATIDRAGEVQLFDALGTALRSVKLSPGASDNAAQIEFSPDGTQLLVSRGSSGRVSVLDAQTLDEVHTLTRVPGASAAFDGDGRRVVVGAADGSVKLWDLANDTVQAAVSTDQPIAGEAVSADGSVLALAEQRIGQVWNLRDGTQRDLRGHTDSLTSIDLNGEGSMAVTAARDNTLRLWNTRTGAQVAVLRGHSGPVTSVRFSGDQRHVLSGSADGTVRWWDLRTGGQVLVLRGRSGPVSSVAHSESGELIGSVSSDGTLQLYRCTLCGSVDQLLAAANERLPDRPSDAELQRFLESHSSPVAQPAY